MLRRVWARHFAREDGLPPEAGGGVRLKPKDELPTAAGGIESPYDPEARYRRRGEVAWTGYIVPLSETCGENTVHLVTHVMTTTAAVHEAGCTGPIHRALVATGPPPGEHLVDAAYVDGELVARSREELGMTLLGPPPPNPAWQSKVAGAFDLDRFEIDWEPPAGPAAREARRPRAGARGSTGPAAPTSASYGGKPTAARARRARCARATGTSPGT